MMHYRGRPNRLLRRLVLSEGEALPSPGEALSDHRGKPVGHLGTVLIHPQTGARIGLAIVKRKAAEPGTELTLQGGATAVVEASGPKPGDA